MYEYRILKMNYIFADKTRFFFFFFLRIHGKIERTASHKQSTWDRCFAIRNGTVRCTSVARPVSGFAASPFKFDFELLKLQVRYEISLCSYDMYFNLLSVALNGISVTCAVSRYNTYLTLFLLRTRVQYVNHYVSSINRN